MFRRRTALQKRESEHKLGLDKRRTISKTSKYGKVYNNLHTDYTNWTLTVNDYSLMMPSQVVVTVTETEDFNDADQRTEFLFLLANLTAVCVGVAFSYA